MVDESVKKDSQNDLKLTFETGLSWSIWLVFRFAPYVFLEAEEKEGIWCKLESGLDGP